MLVVSGWTRTKKSLWKGSDWRNKTTHNENLKKPEKLLRTLKKHMCKSDCWSKICRDEGLVLKVMSSDLLQPFFDKLIKRKWLNNTEAFEAIEASIKQHFKKFKRMDPPPYQVKLNSFAHVTAAGRSSLLWSTGAGGRGAQAGPGGVCPSHHARSGHLHILEDEEEDGLPPARRSQAAERALQGSGEPLLPKQITLKDFFLLVFSETLTKGHRHARSFQGRKSINQLQSPEL